MPVGRLSFRHALIGGVSAGLLNHAPWVGMVLQHDFASPTGLRIIRDAIAVAQRRNLRDCAAARAQVIANANAWAGTRLISRRNPWI
jgi:hypothetical protein